MHSATLSNFIRTNHYRTIIGISAIALTSVSVAGCRSNKPLSSMVRVTEDPTSIAADVPPAEQRLATTTNGRRSSAKLASNATPDSSSPKDLAEAVAGMPKVFQDNAKPSDVTTSQDSAIAKSITDSIASDPKPDADKQSDTAKSIANAIAQINPLSRSGDKNPHAEKTESKSAVANVTATDSQLKKTVSKAPSPVATTDILPKQTGDVSVTPGGLVSASLTDLSSPSNKAPSPSVRAIAATKTGSKTTAAPKPLEPSTVTSTSVEPEALVASEPGKRPSVKRRPVGQTKQPFAMKDALQSSLAALPQLPDSKPDPNAASPRRIGTTQSLLADRQPMPKKNTPPSAVAKPEPATAHIGDVAVASEQTLSDQISTSARPSQPPIATKPEPVPSDVLNENQVRPVSHDSGDGKLAVASLRQDALPGPMPTALPQQELTKAELYGQLLDRILDPQPNESPSDRERRQIIARHLMVLAGEPESAVESMEGMNATEQRYLKNQLLGLWTMIDPQGHPSSGRRITEALPKYREATRYMAAATDSLTLNSLEFCTEIESYGQIKPFDGNRFVASQQVILYCEVENFAAENRDNQFQTQLQGSYDIYDVSGTKVISQLLPVDQQRSRNQLRDYFVAYQMNLPKGLPAGTYRLQLTLEDVVGKKYGQANIPFEIR